MFPVLHAESPSARQIAHLDEPVLEDMTILREGYRVFEVHISSHLN